jgi:hypothetical protein
VGLKASVGEAGEMQRGPEAIAAVGEIMSCRGSGRRGIDAAKYHVEVFGEDVRFVWGQGRSRDLPTPRAWPPCNSDLWGRRSGMPARFSFLYR